MRGLYPILPPLLSIMHSLHHRRLLSPPHPSLTSFLYVFCLPQTFVIPSLSHCSHTALSPPKTFFLSASPSLPLYHKRLSLSSHSVHHALFSQQIQCTCSLLTSYSPSSSPFSATFFPSSPPLPSPLPPPLLLSLPSLLLSSPFSSPHPLPSPPFPSLPSPSLPFLLFLLSSPPSSS